MDLFARNLNLPGGLSQSGLLPWRHSAQHWRHALAVAVASPPGRRRAPPCRKWTGRPPRASALSTLPCSLSPRSPPGAETLTLARSPKPPPSAAAHPRRLRPPRGPLTPPPARPRAPLPPGAWDWAGVAWRRRTRPRPPASAAPPPGPFRRRRSSSGLPDLSPSSLVSSRCLHAPPPSFSPAVPRFPRAPPPAAAMLLAAGRPGDQMVHAAAPGLPSGSSTS